MRVAGYGESVRKWRVRRHNVNRAIPWSAAPAPPSSAMRVVILSHRYVDPAARGKLRALAGTGSEIATLVPERWAAPGGALTKTDFGNDGAVRIVPVPVHGEGDEARWQRRAVRRLLDEFRPDLLQIEEESWTPAAARLAGFARRRKLPAVLVTLHNRPRAFTFRERLRRRRVLNTVTGVIAGNTAAAALIAAARPDLPTTVIPQIGATPPFAMPAREDGQALRIGFVGRLVAERGLDLLLRAAVQVHGAWTLDVIGTGPAQAELEQLAERLGIASRVTWLGALPRAELAAIWPRLDCIAAPARTTAQWMDTTAPFIVEAMGFGVVPIVTSSGVLPETVGDAGLVAPENDPAALAPLLLRLLEAPAERAALAAAARRRAVTHYSHETLARQTRSFWDSVVATS